MAERRDPAESVRALYDAINAGEIEVALELLDSDVAWVRPPDVPVTGTLSGREQVARMWRAFARPTGRLEIVPTRVRPQADGVLVHVSFRGEGPDGPFEFAGVQTFRVADDGLIAEVREFRSITEGEADLG